MAITVRKKFIGAALGACFVVVAACGSSDTPGGTQGTGGSGATPGATGGANVPGTGGAASGTGGSTTGMGGATVPVGGMPGGNGTCDSVAVMCAGKGSADFVIADFEEGDGSVLSTDMTGGTFFTFNDASAGGIQVPAPMEPIEAAAICGGGRCADDAMKSKYALHMTANGFNEWGGLLGTDIAFTAMRGTFDASAYKGIAFWARSGSAAALPKDRKVRFVFIDANTDPAGGKCMQPGTAMNACYNDWGVDLTLTPEWTRYEVPFTSLKQGDWGMKFAAFEVAKIYGMQWKFAKGVNLDIWLDDVGFYK